MLLSPMFREPATFLPLIASPVWTVLILVGAAGAWLRACEMPIPDSAMAVTNGNCMKTRQPRPPGDVFDIISS